MGPGKGCKRFTGALCEHAAGLQRLIEVSRLRGAPAGYVLFRREVGDVDGRAVLRPGQLCRLDLGQATHLDCNRYDMCKAGLYQCLRQAESGY